MKISENFILRNVAGSCVVVPVGSACAKLNGMITLQNETAEFIWRCFEENVSIEDVVEKITNRYDIDSERALASVNRFIDLLKPYGVFAENE